MKWLGTGGKKNLKRDFMQTEDLKNYQINYLKEDQNNTTLHKKKTGSIKIM